MKPADRRDLGEQLLVFRVGDLSGQPRQDRQPHLRILFVHTERVRRRDSGLPAADILRQADPRVAVTDPRNRQRVRHHARYLLIVPDESRGARSPGPA
ncbi:hypothetical protein ABZ260_08600 [Streptosporangium sp. NPDC006013]|uniref:hypothetical protein n=1 Tax=Streptosporangium sp. NPDC006013 TaxID=3155596 RepID=UPI0033A43B75